MSGRQKLYGLIEAGGTKFVCAVGTSADDIHGRQVIPTRHPEETLGAVEGYFRSAIKEHGTLDAIGVGCFGPIDLDRGSTTYGSILETTKPDWTGVDIVGFLAKVFGVPVAIDTDVNAALVGEAAYGAGRGLEHLVYITVGTGIGAGIMEGGRIIYGTGHSEIGHLFASPRSDDTDFLGVCPFHGNACFEGLASGPAMKARWGQPAHDLPDQHPAWDLQARYLAILCLNISMTTMPERIILGGGVMQREHLFDLIRHHFVRLNNGYNGLHRSLDHMSSYIVPAALNPNAGVIGALKIARNIERAQPAYLDSVERT